MTKDNTKTVKIQARKEKLKLHPDAPVKLTRQGGTFAEVMYMAKKPRQGAKKLSKDEYVVLSTGEVKEYKKTENKQRESLSKTFSKLRGIIRANFEGCAENQKLITLTYRENMQDAERMLVDFKVFWKRFAYQYKGHKLEYVAVAEPQERGAWHLHVMCKSDQPKWWVDMDKLNKQWGHGYVTVEALKSDDMGQYYVAYFTSLADETKAKPGEVSGDMSKSRVKGGRLHFYPKNMKFYRCSRGIIRPKSEDAVYDDVLGEYGEPKHVNTYSITMDCYNKNGEEIKDKEINLIQKQTHERQKGGDENGDD